MTMPACLRLDLDLDALMSRAQMVRPWLWRRTSVRAVVASRIVIAALPRRHGPAGRLRAARRRRLRLRSQRGCHDALHVEVRWQLRHEHRDAPLLQAGKGIGPPPPPH